jgi:hypothetical protein
LVDFYILIKGKTVDNSEAKLNCFTKKIVKWKEMFLWETHLKEINIGYMKLCIFAFLQFYQLNFDSWFHKASSVLAIITAAFVLIFPILTIKMRRKPLKK